MLSMIIGMIIDLLYVSKSLPNQCVLIAGVEDVGQINSCNFNILGLQYFLFSLARLIIKIFPTLAIASK